MKITCGCIAFYLPDKTISKKEPSALIRFTLYYLKH